MPVETRKEPISYFTLGTRNKGKIDNIYIASILNVDASNPPISTVRINKVMNPGSFNPGSEQRISEVKIYQATPEQDFTPSLLPWNQEIDKIISKRFKNFWKDET